ncbi:MAG: FxSxx-COOH system tetratricopeptide repeat protein [Streptosporangiaceae bacterium]
MSIAPQVGLIYGNPRLRGRDTVLEKLTDPDERVWVLHGLGGCGKTHLAQEVAFRMRHLRDVWWVSVADSGSLVSGMLAVGRRLEIPDAALQQGDAADVIWQALCDRPEAWLLVIDGANDPTILAGAGKSVAEGQGWLRPVPTKTGMVLVTSRDGSPESWAQGWCRRFHVEMLPPAEAGEVLADYARRSPGLGDDDDAQSLAVRLGGLPLALKLAGRYLFESTEVPTEIVDPNAIRTYRQYQDAIEDAALRRPGGEMTEEWAIELIGQTWDLTLELLEERQGREAVPEARPMLQLLASFAAAPIPYGLLLDMGLLAACPRFRGITADRFWRVVKTLDALDLIDLDFSGEGQGKIRVARLHPLVRDASQPAAGSPERMTFLNLAARLLRRAAAAQRAERPEDPNCWPVWQLLAPHPGYVLDRLEREPGYPEEVAKAAAYAAHRAARYHAACGLHTRAEAQFRSVLTARLRVLGDSNPDTLSTRHQIAYMLRLRGEYAEAEAEFRAVLGARTGVLGADHPDTLITRHEIATIMAAVGEFARAETEFRAVLEARAEVLGPGHQDTLTTRHEVARMLAEQEDRAGAQAVFQGVLEARTRTLGAENPDTLITRHEIARLLADGGDYAGAEAESRDILAISRRVLGPDHPETLITQHEIARVMAEQGGWAGAEAEFRDVWEARRRVLGADHPDTLVTRHEVARMMAEQGDYTGAEAEFRAVLEARTAKLGADHPGTLTTRHEIARMMAERGDRAGAEAEFRAVLEARTAKLGADHPDTLITRHEVARLLADREDYTRAEAESREIRDVSQDVLGADHPITVIARHQFARVLALQGDYGGAEAEFRAVLEARTAKHGADHPDTLITRHEIARLLADREDYTRAEAESREIRDVSQQVLGADHPITLIARHELARVLALQGDYGGAETEFRAVLEARTRKPGADHPDTLITRDALDRVIAAQGPA